MDNSAMKEALQNLVEKVDTFRLHCSIDTGKYAICRADNRQMSIADHMEIREFTTAVDQAIDQARAVLLDAAAVQLPLPIIEETDVLKTNSILYGPAVIHLIDHPPYGYYVRCLIDDKWKTVSRKYLTEIKAWVDAHQEVHYGG